MRLMVTAAALLAVVLASTASEAERGEAGEAISQNLLKGEVYTIDDAGDAIPRAVTQSGRLRPYTGGHTSVGLRIETGGRVLLPTEIRGANASSSTVVGVSGKGTEAVYTGRWQGDSSNGFPILVLTDHGKMTWTADAEVDFVMPSNFYTRQLWVHGDGTGVLELAEGFVADRTQTATVPNAMGTIRLGGATLVTHHSQSLPYNTRPDGRGGVYHNGHVVFENRPGSRWIVRTNQHIYAAQIDFDVHGEIVCEAPLTHNGRRRVCLQVGNGGPFVSSGAFRTTSRDVTITKSGPAMLSLDGQQSYLPGSRMVIREGLVRMHTDPGDGDFVNSAAGAYLSVVVEDGGELHIATPLARVREVHVKSGGRLTLEKGVTLRASAGVRVDAGGRLVLDGGEVEGGVREAKGSGGSDG